MPEGHGFFGGLTSFLRWLVGEVMTASLTLLGSAATLGALAGLYVAAPFGMGAGAAAGLSMFAAVTILVIVAWLYLFFSA